jgi:hypothetical protein
MPYKDIRDQKAWFKRNFKKVQAYKKEYSKIWRIKNKEYSAAASKAWDKANPERRKKNGKRWRRENPEKAAAIVHKRLALIKGNGGSFTSEEWKNLCIKYDKKCLGCRKRKKLEVDHVIPLSKGGTSNIANIQPLCRRCNSTKNAKIIDFRKNTYAGKI